MTKDPKILLLLLALGTAALFAANTFERTVEPTTANLAVDTVEPGNASIHFAQRLAGAPSLVRPSMSGSTPLRGINLSGGEFGTVPGSMHQDYAYPTSEYLAQFAQFDFNIIRLPFRWERLQPALMSDLSERDRGAIRDLVNYATQNGFTVVLDMHNYARRRVDGEEIVVGAAEVPAATLTDAWMRIVEDYRDNDRVWIGLMNEPYGVSPEEWWGVAQEVVLALRRSGVKNKILVPGTSWTGAWTWVSSGNAQFAERFEDPVDNFAFEVHQYLDLNGSGTSGECARDSANRGDDVIQWAESVEADLFFGEIAAGGGVNCEAEYGEFLSRLDRSPAVIGWTAWGAGAWWSSDYHFRIAPAQDGRNHSPHAELLATHLEE